jgi:hypothetical protein
MNSDCLHYRHERDTNAQYCEIEEWDELYGQDDCKGCPRYYNREDAKNDARYGDKDGY